ncbi:hypothetical protein VP01_1526g2 [Puccinia sorghi]|uniref:Uncharacterized protein n=1 Tax=Puccinia sorghi TaxID=27349 RepID=A0A0L6VJ91_9BASI|nr:hypothetical protein VP01_1526g2 [Puccinia sorghi]
MKINKQYTKDLELLIPAYIHYVQFLQQARHKREKNNSESFVPMKNGTFQLRGANLKLTLAQRLPKHYQNDLTQHEYEGKDNSDLCQR